MDKEKLKKLIDALDEAGWVLKGMRPKDFGAYELHIAPTKDTNQPFQSQ